MADLIREQNNDTAEQPSSTTEPVTQTVYRWNYADQAAYDAYSATKKQKRGVLVYALVMTVVFLLCFALLITTLVWYSAGNGSAAQQQAAGVLTTREIAEEVCPATVLIYAEGTEEYAFGTGFFVLPDGYIVTNYHVVENAASLIVTTYRGQEKTAAIVGYSAPEDIAVLKIDGTDYPTVRIGDSSKLFVGDRAVAIGNPSGMEGAWSTTQGIISATSRTVEVNGPNYIALVTMMQTDAPVNPGNSGGPLCNDRGEVIGIISRKMIDTESIGYAIPINGAMEFVSAIIRTGCADSVDSDISKVRPLLGFEGMDIKAGDVYRFEGGFRTCEQDGILIQSINEGVSTPLRKNDVLISFDGRAVSSIEELLNSLYRYEVGDEVVVVVIRGNSQKTFSITLGK